MNPRLFLFLTFIMSLPAWVSSQTVTLPPDKKSPWHVVVDVGDMKIVDKTERFCMQNRSNHPLLTVMIPKRSKANTAAACRDEYRTMLLKRKQGIDTNIDEFPDYAYLEYIVRPPPGEPIPEKHIFAFRAKNGVCVYSHVMKLHYTSADDHLMQFRMLSFSIIDTIHKK